MGLHLDGQPEPRPDPFDPRACWQCHGHRIMWAVALLCDDGDKTWDEVTCWRCDGTGREPAGAIAERGEVPPGEEP